MNLTHFDIAILIGYFAVVAGLALVLLTGKTSSHYVVKARGRAHKRP